MTDQPASAPRRDHDLLLPVALHVIRHQNATGALLRQRFGVGNRTAQLLLHQLEAHGIVAKPADRTRPYEVLCAKTELNAVRRQLSGSPTATPEDQS